MLFDLPAARTLRFAIAEFYAFYRNKLLSVLVQFVRSLAYEYFPLKLLFLPLWMRTAGTIMVYFLISYNFAGAVDRLFSRNFYFQFHPAQCTTNMKLIFQRNALRLAGIFAHHTLLRLFKLFPRNDLQTINRRSKHVPILHCSCVYVTFFKIA